MTDSGASGFYISWQVLLTLMGRSEGRGRNSFAEMFVLAIAVIRHSRGLTTETPKLKDLLARNTESLRPYLEQLEADSASPSSFSGWIDRRSIDAEVRKLMKEAPRLAKIEFRQTPYPKTGGYTWEITGVTPLGRQRLLQNIVDFLIHQKRALQHAIQSENLTDEKLQECAQNQKLIRLVIGSCSGKVPILESSIIDTIKLSDTPIDEPDALSIDQIGEIARSVLTFVSPNKTWLDSICEP